MSFGPASPCRRPKWIKAQKRLKHPYMNMDPGLKSDLWASTPSSSQLQSLKRWLASDFSANSLTIEEYILPQTTYETAPKMINQSLRRKTWTTWLITQKEKRLKRKRRACLPSISETNHPLPMESGSTSFFINKGGNTKKKVCEKIRL